MGNNGSISFNSVILASMSPVIRNAINNIPITDSNEKISIICQNVDITDIEHFFSNILKQTKEIFLSKSLCDFLRDIEINLKSLVKPGGQLDTDGLFSNYNNGENEGSKQDSQFQTLSDEVKMDPDEFIDENDSISKFEEETNQESISILCKIEIDERSESDEDIKDALEMKNDDLEMKNDEQMYTDEDVHQYLARLSSIKTDSNEKNECPKCGNVFVTKYNLKKHIKYSCIVEKEKTRCPICGKALHYFGLKRHLMICESRTKARQEKLKKKEVNPQSYTCKICFFQTMKKGIFDRHIRTLHPDKYGFKQCEKCKESIKVEEFEEHTCVIFNCDICGKGFNRQSSLYTHIETIHDEKGLSSCETCGKLVSTSQMKSHLKSHVPDQEIPCNICGTKLRSERSLKNHLYRHKLGKTECTICGKSVNNLKKHLAQVHPKEDDNENKYQRKNYKPVKTVCTICGNSVYDLNKHMKNMHTKDEDKEHHCQHCGKGFIDLHNLKAHEDNVHNKIKIDKKVCPICGKLISYGNFSRHLKECQNSNVEKDQD